MMITGYLDTGLGLRFQGRGVLLAGIDSSENLCIRFGEASPKLQHHPEPKSDELQPEFICVVFDTLVDMPHLLSSHIY